jgi:hypothetical protein
MALNNSSRDFTKSVCNIDNFFESKIRRSECGYARLKVRQRSFIGRTVSKKEKTGAPPSE